MTETSLWFFTRNQLPSLWDKQFLGANPDGWPVVGNWTNVINRVTLLPIDGVGVVKRNYPQQGYLNWYLKAPVSGHAAGGPADIGPFAYGNVTDIPIVGDWDGAAIQA